MTAWLLDQLPSFMATDDFFRRFVALFAELGDRTVAHADGMEHLADVDVTPDGMIGYLAGWIGIDSIDDTLPIDRRRQLLTRMGELQMWRGTARGLKELLEVVTGGSVEVVDSGGIYVEGMAPPNTKHIVVRAETAGAITPDHLVSLVRDELPADCAFELWVEGVKIAPAAPRGRAE